MQRERMITRLPPGIYIYMRNRGREELSVSPTPTTTDHDHDVHDPTTTSHATTRFTQTRWSHQPPPRGALSSPCVINTVTIMMIFDISNVNLPIRGLCNISAHIQGSCLSYGHSCWGAHGKRNDIQGIPTVRLAAKALLNRSPQNDIAPSLKTQWILSNLISGQFILPFTDKYHVKWSGFPKHKSYVLPKWDHDTAPMTDEDIESIRIPINNKNEDNEIRISDTQGKMHNINDKFENNRGILRMSADEYYKPINDPRKFDILKFLNKGNGDMK